MANMYKLPRYSIFLIKDGCIKDPFKQGYTRIDENNESGEWVKWEDVKPLLSHITETLHRVLNNLEIDFIR